MTLRRAIAFIFLAGGFSQGAMAEIGPDLFSDQHYLNGYWDSQDQSGLGAKSCREAGRSDCAKTLVALKACLSIRKCDTKAVDDEVESAMNDLRKLPKTSSRYPALVYWISRITPVLGVDSKTQRDRLTRLGIEYRYSEIPRNWELVHSSLEALAMERQDNVWGRQAFLEMTRTGWNAFPQCWIGSPIPTVIQRGEDFLKRYPKSEVSAGVVYALALAYQNWFELLKAGMPERVGKSRSFDSEVPRTKAIAYYTQYVGMIGKTSDVLRKTLDQLKQNVSPQKDPLHSGEPYSCMGD